MEISGAKLDRSDVEAKDATVLSTLTELASTSREGSLGAGSREDVELFMQAGELERLGRVSQAIKFYEKAFRLNPYVHRLVGPSGDVLDDASVDTRQCAVAATRPKFQPVVPGAIEEVTGTMDPTAARPLGLPLDILARVLYWVGLSHAVSLEQCARTCKTMYLASRHGCIWRTLCRATSAVGRIEGKARRKDQKQIDRLLASFSGIPPSLRYRQLYFTIPRIRTDGLYICRISYFRPGLTDGAFFQPVHLVTYYRYLRFFPAIDGERVVFFVVSTEEPRTIIDALRHPPDQSLTKTIPQRAQLADLSQVDLFSAAGPPYGNVHGKSFTPPLNRANVFIGKYGREASTSPSYSLALYDSHSPQRSVFALDLTVIQRPPPSLSSAIVCDHYRRLSSPSTPQGSINVHEFDTRDWGKFFFSRVRSYIS